MNRRKYLQYSLGGFALLGTAGFGNPLLSSPLEPSSEESEKAFKPSSPKYTLPPLAYSYSDLEPYIDAQTMELHHSIHHQSYVNGLNNALSKLEEARHNNDYSLVKHWSREVGFHGAGHFLHALFWEILSPDGGGEPSETPLLKAIKESFGTFDSFKAHFIAASTAVEASGWGILAWEPLAEKLMVIQAEKHQNISPVTMVPLLAVDVWEHAYYLRYQNRRADYVKSFFNVVDWDAVARNYERARTFTG